MRHEHDPGTLDLMTGGLWLGYARVSTDDQELAHVKKLHTITLRFYSSHF
jgi:hypothetical protein